jgi:hypothetical protein
MNRCGECLPFNAAIAREILGGKGAQRKASQHS